jgi:hypothetical protein
MFISTSFSHTHTRVVQGFGLFYILDCYFVSQALIPKLLSQPISRPPHELTKKIKSASCRYWIFYDYINEEIAGTAREILRELEKLCRRRAAGDIM